MTVSCAVPSTLVKRLGNKLGIAMAGLWKCSKIGTLWGKMGQIFALVVVGDYGNTTNGKMKNRKCR
ncbi:hypothetical protein [Mediterraneibacter gnavus]|uniref:hypothetical protein n=1 Tax=Mediterraneibacter gnavus TaxID=33038 RepID=UPI0004B259FF|nr:hypothetical protein [Mediterraneibacter gnavus]